MAVKHQDFVLAYMMCLGLRLNSKNSVLSSLQMTTFLRVVWDSTTMQEHLFPACMIQGQTATVKQFQKLLGLMVAVSSVMAFCK